MDALAEALKRENATAGELFQTLVIQDLDFVIQDLDFVNRDSI